MRESSVSELQVNYYFNTYVVEWFRNNNIDIQQLIIIPSTSDMYGRTIAMTYAMMSINTIPPQWQHDPTIRDKEGMTVAMHLAQNGRVIPNRWLHDMTLCDNMGKTIPMFYVITTFWHTPLPSGSYHYPTICDKEGMTFAMHLAQNGCTIHNQWLHDKKLRNKRGKTVMQILTDRGCVNIPDEWRLEPIHVNYDKVMDEKQCMICLEEGVEKAVATMCGHVMCVECFKKYVKHMCPYCKYNGFVVYDV